MTVRIETEVKTRPVNVEMGDLDVLQHLKMGDDETLGAVIHRVLGMYDEFQFREEYTTKLEMEGGERLIKIAALERDLDERMSEIESMREGAVPHEGYDPKLEKLNSVVTRQAMKIESLRREIGECMSEIEVLREAAKPAVIDIGAVANLREENRQLSEDIENLRREKDELISVRTVLRKSLQLAHAAGDELTKPYKKQIEVLNDTIARMREQQQEIIAANEAEVREQDVMMGDPNDKLVLRYPKPNEPISIVISTMRGTFDDAIAGMRERHQKIIVADEVVTIEELKDDESVSTMIHTGRDTVINIIIGGGEAK